MTPEAAGFDLRRDYPTLLAYRSEGLRRFGARLTEDHHKLPATVYWPNVFFGKHVEVTGTRVGPARVTAIAPAFQAAMRALARVPAPRVLDIGCGDGAFYTYLRSSGARFRDGLVYVGVDPARPAGARFPVHATLGELEGEKFDAVMMSEVAEHMPAQAFIDDYVSKVGAYMRESASFIVGLPNPLAPVALHRDVTHVQHYPWYDLYAILRAFFEDVTPSRTFFVYSPRKLLLLPLRRVIAAALNVDWCDGLLMVARRPKAAVRPA